MNKQQQIINRVNHIRVFDVKDINNAMVEELRQLYKDYKLIIDLHNYYIHNFKRKYTYDNMPVFWKNIIKLSNEIVTDGIYSIILSNKDTNIKVAFRELRSYAYTLQRKWINL